MGQGLEVALVLFTALVTANLPFLNERIMAVGPRRYPKHMGWRLLELLLWCAVTVSLGMALEARIGQAHPQGWEFYAAMLCLFLTFAFPGFVWRYLTASRGRTRNSGSGDESAQPPADRAS